MQIPALAHLSGKRGVAAHGCRDSESLLSELAHHLQYLRHESSSGALKLVEVIMANKNLFRSLAGKLLPQTNAVNSESAPAYAFAPEHALAQYAMTGCINGTFYASAEKQLEEILKLTEDVSPHFIAQTAIYAREKGYMKDLPALLCAVLSVREPQLLAPVFDRVIDNGKMLRNFVQIMRSGVVGRKSLGSLPKRLVTEWIERRSDGALFGDSVGNSPSLADVIKMVHPKPGSAMREALFGYLIDRKHDASLLPEIVRSFEDYKAKRTKAVPDVPFQFLTALELGKAEWTKIARNASWQTTRMNLNTFARHGVFEEHEMVRTVAKRLRDERAIERARVFPYQLMSAFLASGNDVPEEIRDALQDAMEHAVKNVPAFEGRVVVCPDVSGSMQSPVTGHRKGATSAVRCVDVAALVAAAVLRRNRGAMVLPFEQDVVTLSVNARDSIMTNARLLAAVGGGGTNCSAPLARLNATKTKADVVIMVSDNESWVDARFGKGTATLEQWERFKQRNPSARLVCVDVQPNRTTQALERADILNVGGFSDQVFQLIEQFAAGTLEAGHFVGVIEQVQL